MIEFFQHADPDRSGGKGRNLIALTKALFPVPPGFIAMFDVYREYRETGKISDNTAQQIIGHYHQLCRETGNRFVSVRSSASAEDLRSASFAGQYDTYLYVQSEEELLTRIVDCWDSLYSERARVYRERMNIHAANIQMAVVVQSMIDPKSAGVLFTKYPYNSMDAMVVESSWGCGETVVSGKVTPDHYVVSACEPHSVLEKLPGKKDTRLRGSDVGAVEERIDGEERETESLTENELTELCKFGKRVEGHFGFSQDIEWALGDDGKIYILQSRPVTV